MTQRERCDGASLHPRRNTLVYKRIMGVMVAVRGACSHCGKETALTMAGNIREHTPAKREVK